MIAEFAARGSSMSTLRVTNEKSTNVEVEKHRNRFTLAQLMAQDPSRYIGLQFTCMVTLKDIDETKGWFYRSCDQCPKKLQPRGNSFVCEDHQPVIQPKNIYFFSTFISDATGEAKAVFFDTAGTTLLRRECKAMVEDFGFTDPHTLPTPLTFLKGSKKLLQIWYSRSSRQGNVDFIVDRVFDDGLTTADATVSEKEDTTDAPSTAAPVLSSSSVYTESKRLRDLMFRRELFISPDDTNTEQVKRQRAGEGASDQHTEESAADR